MEEFPSHVKDLHQNANRKFEEEFSVLFITMFVYYFCLLAREGVHTPISALL